MRVGDGQRLGPRALPAIALLAVVLVVLALAGCADAGAGTAGNGPSAEVVPATATPSVTTTPGGRPTATPIAITDLGAFRQQLALAASSGSWGRLAPLLSPQLTFQGPAAGGAKIEMPAAGQALKGIFTSNTPWGQSAQWEVDIHSCYAGTTPKEQQMGFDGGSGVFLLVGMGKWQGYWVVAWVFEDPLGGGDGCFSGG